MSDSKTLRVFNLNAWGFRLVSSGLKEKKARFEALRNVLACNEYDVALLQELWYRADYDLLKALFPHSSYLSDHYNNATGNIAPLGCSGLVILSKFPLEEVEFLPFERRGGLITFDGEILVQKGVGRARIHLPMNGHTSLKIDLFTTHLVAYVGTKFRDWINDKLRYKQALELHQMIENSDADIKILSGDFNTPPKVGNQEPYGLLASVMTDSLIDKFPNASLDPDFATIGKKTPSSEIFLTKVGLLL